jgi:hypothetical protein
MTLKQMLTLAPDLPQRIHFGFNDAIDFCLWILEVDGLQVSPFHLHNPHGTKELRSDGLTSESWQTWFECVTCLQDPNLRRTDLSVSAESWAETQVLMFRRMAEQMTTLPGFSEDTVESIDFEALRQTLVNHHHLEQQRRSIAEQRLQAQLEPD